MFVNVPIGIVAALLAGLDRDRQAQLTTMADSTSVAQALGDLEPAKLDERLVRAKSGAAAARLHETQHAHSSSSGASWPGLRMPNSRRRSCKLCLCKPIVAAVREIFQRCAPNWRNR